MNRYNLDWNAFNEGFQKTLDKQAALGAGGGGVKNFFLKGVAHAKDLGKDTAKSVATTTAAEGVKHVMTPTHAYQAPAAGGFNLASMLGGMLPQQPAYAPPAINVQVQPQQENNLLKNPTEVGSLSSPAQANSRLTTTLEDPTYGFASLKRANVMDLVIKNLQHKATNSVISNIMQPDAETSTPSKEEIEIVTKHPEMREVFKDPKNREYLEKLISS